MGTYETRHMVATVEFRFANRMMKPGDPFECTVRDADWLRQRGRAADDVRRKPPAPIVKPTEAKPIATIVEPTEKADPNALVLTTKAASGLTGEQIQSGSSGPAGTAADPATGKVPAPEGVGKGPGSPVAPLSTAALTSDTPPVQSSLPRTATAVKPKTMTPSVTVKATGVLDPAKADAAKKPADAA